MRSVNVRCRWKGNGDKVLLVVSVRWWWCWLEALHCNRQRTYSSQSMWAQYFRECMFSIAVERFGVLLCFHFQKGNSISMIYIFFGCLACMLSIQLELCSARTDSLPCFSIPSSQSSTSTYSAQPEEKLFPLSYESFVEWAGCSDSSYTQRIALAFGVLFYRILSLQHRFTYKCASS